jgi:hypothetical protein
MMEAPVQYAKASDGFNIAHHAIGEGPSFACLKIGAHNRAEATAYAFRNEIALSS